MQEIKPEKLFRILNQSDLNSGKENNPFKTHGLLSILCSGTCTIMGLKMHLAGIRLDFAIFYGCSERDPGASVILLL